VDWVLHKSALRVEHGDAPERVDRRNLPLSKVQDIPMRSEITLFNKGMWLVDVGDYDNDGKSELVFAIDRYDQGGRI
jgi:hypothetical protein